MVQEPRVSIILLNWNTWSDTIECLESLADISYENHDIVIVDNGSNDDSIKRIDEYLRGSNWLPRTNLEEDSVSTWSYLSVNRGVTGRTRRCDMIATAANRGFTGGNNLAMEFALREHQPDYILLLNNDTVVSTNFLGELVEAMEENRDVGFASPMILDYDVEATIHKTNIIQYAGAVQSLYLFIPLHRRQAEIDDGTEVLPSTTGYAHGTCMMVRARTIADIGMLDEDFFCYREENDWGLRGKKKGWGALFVPTSKIWHKGGRSSGKVRGMALYYMARNSILIVKKNGSPFERAVFALSFASFAFPYRIVKLIFLKRDMGSAKVYMKGIRDGMRWKPSDQ